MRHLKVLSFFVLFLILSIINSAPTGESQSLYDVLSSDKRFEKLLKQKFAVECKTNKPICTALIDVALRFNEAQLEFANDEIQMGEDFCEGSLLKTLPDTPTLAETSDFIKSYNLTWFKDNLKKNDGKMCIDECTYESYDDYSLKIKPVCFFIYDQYKLLASNNENKISSEKISSTESISLEQKQKKVSGNETQQDPKGSIVSEAGTLNLVNVIEAKKSVEAQNITVNKTETTEEQVHTEEQIKMSTNETKKVNDLPQSTSPATVVQSSNKSDTAQLKTDTKTTSINLDDEQNGLIDNAVFDDNQEADNGNLNDIDGGVNGDDDDDDMYSVDLPLRDNNLNINKLQQEQLTDIEPHDSDNPQRVQSAPFEEDPDSNFFTYLCIIMFLTIVLYILYHNRQKILALLLEGRQGRNSRRPRSRGGSKAAYSKLDCNLEEAIMSKKSLSGKSMDIIY